MNIVLVVLFCLAILFQTTRCSDFDISFSEITAAYRNRIELADSLNAPPSAIFELLFEYFKESSFAFLETKGNASESDTASDRFSLVHSCVANIPPPYIVPDGKTVTKKLIERYIEEIVRLHVFMKVSTGINDTHVDNIVDFANFLTILGPDMALYLSEINENRVFILTEVVLKFSKVSPKTLLIFEYLYSHVKTKSLGKFFDLFFQNFDWNYMILPKFKHRLDDRNEFLKHFNVFASHLLESLVSLEENGKQEIWNNSALQLIICFLESPYSAEFKGFLEGLFLKIDFKAILNVSTCLDAIYEYLAIAPSLRICRLLVEKTLCDNVVSALDPIANPTIGQILDKLKQVVESDFEVACNGLSASSKSAFEDINLVTQEYTAAIDTFEKASSSMKRIAKLESVEIVALTRSIRGTKEAYVKFLTFFTTSSKAVALSSSVLCPVSKFLVSPNFSKTVIRSVIPDLTLFVIEAFEVFGIPATEATSETLISFRGAIVILSQVIGSFPQDKAAICFEKLVHMLPIFYTTLGNDDGFYDLIAFHTFIAKLGIEDSSSSFSRILVEVLAKTKSPNVFTLVENACDHLHLSKSVIFSEALVRRIRDIVQHPKGNWVVADLVIIVSFGRKMIHRSILDSYQAQVFDLFLKHVHNK